MSQITPISTCPRCRYETDRAGHIEDELVVPQPGDRSICMQCAHIATYDESMGLRELTKDEVIALAIDPKWLAYYGHIRTAIKQTMGSRFKGN